MKLLFLVVAAVACSSRPVEPLTPFQIPVWTTIPSDDEIVRAIIGTSGSADQRAEAEAVTREFLLPRLQEQKREVSKLRWELQNLQIAFESVRNHHPADAFVRFAVFEEISNIESRAQRLAFVRLKQALWPTESTPEAWASTDAIEPGSVAAAAAGLRFRLQEIEGRYASRWPSMFAHGVVELSDRDSGTHRTVVLARNHLHVALTGEYAVTTGGIYDELTARGIKTTTVLENRPY